jgi:hypothetical protein
MTSSAAEPTSGITALSIVTMITADDPFEAVAGYGLVRELTIMSGGLDQTQHPSCDFMYRGRR